MQGKKRPAEGDVGPPKKLTITSFFSPIQNKQATNIKDVIVLDESDSDEGLQPSSSCIGLTPQPVQEQSPPPKANPFNKTSSVIARWPEDAFKKPASQQQTDDKRLGGSIAGAVVAASNGFALTQRSHSVSHVSETILPGATAGRTHVTATQFGTQAQSGVDEVASPELSEEQVTWA